MSDTQQLSEPAGEASAIRIYSVVLSVGVVCALSIVTVYEVTRPIIEQNQIALRQAAILDVLADANTTAAFEFDPAKGSFVAATDESVGEVVHAGFDDQNQLVGLAIEASRMGYQDVIRLLYGYSFKQQAVIGIQVLESRETPGLGDRIEKDDQFLLNFEALDVRLDESGDSLVNPVTFVKPGEKTQPWQIDGITGATISSRAVADLLAESTARWISRVHGRQADFVPLDGEASNVE